MIGRIIEFSARHRGLVFLVTAAAVAAGVWSMRHLPLDATPDLSDTQVIVYSKWDRSPDVIEDQVTYPIVSSLLGAPKVKAVRGYSDFGYSYVYVVFEDGTDIYWARSRTLEYLSSVLPRLPQGVKTELGPDATGLGWVFQYVLVDESGKHDLAALRSYQDWTLRYHLKAVKGVADVAPIGGYVRQYQVNVDPQRLQAYGLSIARVTEAVRSGNNDVGGRLIESGGAEYMVRGHGYARSVEDLESIVLANGENGAPVRIKDVASVALGPDLRRGIADLDGKGEAVSGIVIMREGENALEVIERVKSRLKEIEPGMPAGMKVVPIYDRSELINRSIDTLKLTVIEIMVTVALVILAFLWHIPSAIVPLVTIPVAVLLAFIPFRMMGLTANIMSLGGIAIAIGALVDAAIVVVEQTHKKLEIWKRNGGAGDGSGGGVGSAGDGRRPEAGALEARQDHRAVIIQAVKEVGGPGFFALLVIGVSFLPILALEGQEGRLFKPLAYTKTLTMLIAAVLAITLDPALRLMFTRMKKFSFKPRLLCRAANAVAVGTIRPEESHPISRALMRIYEPVVAWSLRRYAFVIGGAAALVVLAIPIYRQLGAEFMPPLDEGALLYMPTTMPGISIAEAQKLLQGTDRIIKRFPEVDRVLGKAGRAETPTDPAPLSMLETVITLKPKPLWRKVPTWYSAWAPSFLKVIFRRITPDHISQEALIAELDQALTLPGVANAWTMPVRGRIDMLTTGLRTTVGLKISGADLATIDALGARVEKLLPQVRGTRSVFAERTAAGYFVDIEWNRSELARHGLSIDDAQAAVQNAIGGENVTTTVQGRERYPVNVRYLRDFRGDLGALGKVLIAAAGGQRQVPLAELATVKAATGPSMIRNEDGLLTGYVYVDLAGRDPQGYVEESRQLLREKLQLPPGYALSWSGQYEAMQRVRERLSTVVPLTLALILLLLYLNTRSLAKTFIVLLAVPFSAVGAFAFLWLLGYNLSIAVWVGLIALLGVDAETGVYMLLYLDLACDQAKREGRLGTLAELQQAIREGAVKRLRPKFMTVATTFLGLVPILWATGTGSDVMKRIAAPMVGGILTSFLLELVVYPPIYQIWKWNFELKRRAVAEPVAAAQTARLENAA
ncbi:MAG TPA: CusA/CzcA family heavy metal efflux RND transporter [Myxococcales bacterium]|nr:CusA/CzcA family heavy metal efflux RND transporter [Myxococcales bacterium]